MPYNHYALSLAASLSILIGSLIGAYAVPTPVMATAEAKVCKLLPMADLEAHYSSKAQRVSGSENPALSVCTANFGSYTARLESGPHDPVQLAPNVATMLMGVKAMLGSSKQLQLLDTQDFGRVGCYRTKVSSGGETAYSTVCVMMPDGWYLNFTMTHADPQRVTFDIVRSMVEKIAARRK